MCIDGRVGISVTLLAQTKHIFVSYSVTLPSPTNLAWTPQTHRVTTGVGGEPIGALHRSLVRNTVRCGEGGAGEEGEDGDHDDGDGGDQH